MKKLITIMIALLPLAAMAQKFALVDMEYIYRNIPAYERATEQLNQVARKWQAEVEALQNEAQTMFKAYQGEVAFLSEENKTKREEEIVKKEREAADLKKKYFGPEGEMSKKRESLMAPINDEVYNAIKDISDQKGYMLVLDRSSDAGIIFANPKADISAEVLTKLGYSY